MRIQRLSFKQFRRTHQDVVRDAAYQIIALCTWAELLLLSQVSTSFRDAARAVLYNRLSYLLAEFTLDSDTFMNKLYSVGGAIVGDLTSRLTADNLDAVYNFRLTSCLAAHCLSIVVADGLNALELVRWFHHWNPGYFWRATQTTADSGLVVGFKNVVDVVEVHKQAKAMDDLPSLP